MLHYQAGPVFIIEDDPVDCEAIERVLASRFRRAYSIFGDAESAARAIAAGVRPCLIFLDHGLPLVSGLELLGRLRSAEETSSIPIIVFSGQVDTIRDIAWDKGANCVLPKPNDAEDFARVVETACLLYLDSGISQAIAK